MLLVVLFYWFPNGGAMMIYWQESDSLSYTHSLSHSLTHSLSFMCSARNAARALRMVEVHGDLASVVWPGGEQAGQGEEEETRLRKLNRMAAVRHSEHKGGATEHKPYMVRCTTE